MNTWFIHLVRFECALIAVYHIFIGVAATLTPEGAAQVAPVMYGISLDVFAPMKSEYIIIIRYMGAFAITLGVLMAVAAWNPQKHRTIIFGGAIFFLIRILDRILGADTLVALFNTSSTQNILYMLFMASIVFILGAFVLYSPKLLANKPI
ncbi:MAG: hypothetical protein GY808_14390 [Gammaproteobacteria bacterium]|nr:hypothetical protein [Gammaproteobacteria bacterium]